MTTIKIHNITTGEVIERDMNPEELVQWEADQAAALAEKNAEMEKIVFRQALLDRLGITEEEAKLLLG